MNKMKYAGLAALSIVVAGLAGAAPAPATNNPAAPAKPALGANLFGDDIVAKAKGVEIKRSQLDEALVNWKMSAAARGQTLPPEAQAQLERGLLDELIIRQLLLTRATPADEAKGKEQFKSGIQRLKTNGKLTDEEFDQKIAPQLRLMGITREQWEKQGTDQATMQAVLERELKVDVSDAEAKKYYEDNTSKFEEPEKAKAAHILLSTKDPTDNNPDPSQKKDLPETQKQAKRKQIDDILKRARGGEDFTKLAKEFSEDPAVKENDGEYTFSRDDQFVPEFKSAAFSLKTNQISDPVLTVFGYHIIKLVERIPAKKEPYTGPDTKSILRKPDGSYATIRDIIVNDGMQKQMKDYINRLKKEANVEILDAKLKVVEVPDPVKPK